ncbi:SMC-Scp complex subunit ScpB [soil metagenome]
MNIEQHIEAILLFKNEHVSFVELSKILNASLEDIQNAVSSLQNIYKDRGIVLVTSSEKVCFGTHKDASTLIEQIQKDELSKDIGRAGLETLSIILYKGPISRKEIDYIRGVNSGFILRNLLIRGLIERSDADKGERSFAYKPTIDLLKHLGLTSTEELPEFNDSRAKLDIFAKTAEIGDDTQT